MTLRTSLRSLTLSLLLISNNVAAQLPQATKESDEEKAKARKELERKALVLLEETLQGVQALKLPENRAAIRVQAADLLWARDEKRARSLFRDAAADVATARGADSTGRDHAGWMLTQLRAQLLNTAASRDPQLALELLRDSRPQAEEGAAPATDADPDTELRLEQSIVAQAAASDPKALLRLAEETLDKGVTFGVLGVLDKLRRKDAEAATKLAGKIVGKLRGQSLSGGREAFSVAVSLLGLVLLPQTASRSLGGAPPPTTRPAEKPKPLVMEESDVRELADLVSVAALRDSSAMGAYGLMFALRPLLPELEKRVPARAAQVRAKLAETDKALDPRARVWMQFESVMNKPPEAILEEAAKAPAEMRGEFYSAAALKYMNAGEVERARQVAAEHLRGEQREQVLAYVERAEVARAVEKGSTDEAKAVVARIQSKERRAGAMAEVAVALALKGDRKAASQLLEEARGLVDRQPDNERETEALFEVARGYALVEPARTFEMIDPLIDHANDLLTAAALLEKFGRGGGIFRKGEMVISLGLGELGGAYARYVKALAELARVDFERTKATADRFNRDEARLMARLVIALSILSDRLGDTVPPAPGYAVGGGIVIRH
ncbi:MAG: hypothetical protein LC795_20650 [Acidobacteria bacterium]|nr:hypothetical protein [Acidobacteriota bacterium]